MRNVMLRLLAAAGLLAAATACAGEAPNFVLIIADDVSFDDLGCYGHPTIKTPHLDALAAEGRVFDNAILTASSCSPTRCSLITGRYPHNTGAPELHVPLPTGQFLFPQALREAGYYTALVGKNHMGAAVGPAFDAVLGGGGPGNERNWVRQLRERPVEKPFFLWLAATDAHRDWQTTDEAPEYGPADAVVPQYLVDGPQTRADLAAHYHEISRLDYYVGAVRAELERQGVAENTFLFFMADNGRPFPRCKTRLYDSGVKTPLVVWRPGTIAPARTAALASTVDLAATFLEQAGVAIDPHVQGVSLAPVLADPGATVRDYAFSEHNWHVHYAHERSVRMGPWLYIRNSARDRLGLCIESGPLYPAGRELWDAVDAGSLNDAQRQMFVYPRPREELYHRGDDPHQLHNLARDAEHAAVLAELRGVLDQWADETGDGVAANPTVDTPLEGMRPELRAEFVHGDMPGADRGAAEILAAGPIRQESTEVTEQETR
jgi:N-sulfoglucosamine sulfohydrolase